MAFYLTHTKTNPDEIGIHVLILEHTTINVVVNNVVLVKSNKQPQAIHSAISETRYRAMNLGEI